MVGIKFLPPARTFSHCHRLCTDRMWSNEPAIQRVPGSHCPRTKQPEAGTRHTPHLASLGIRNYNPQYACTIIHPDDETSSADWRGGNSTCRLIMSHFQSTLLVEYTTGYDILTGKATRIGWFVWITQIHVERGRTWAKSCDRKPPSKEMLSPLFLPWPYFCECTGLDLL